MDVISILRYQRSWKIYQPSISSVIRAAAANLAGSMFNSWDGHYLILTLSSVEEKKLKHKKDTVCKMMTVWINQKQDLAV